MQDENNTVVGAEPRSVTVRNRLLGRGAYTLVFNQSNELLVSKRTASKGSAGRLPGQGGRRRNFPGRCHSHGSCPCDVADGRSFPPLVPSLPAPSSRTSPAATGSTHTIKPSSRCRPPARTTSSRKNREKAGEAGKEAGKGGKQDQEGGGQPSREKEAGKG
eukprot:363357-Chlamydomonas_euryale.AAC.1